MLTWEQNNFVDQVAGKNHLGKTVISFTLQSSACSSTMDYCNITTTIPLQTIFVFCMSYHVFMIHCDGVIFSAIMCVCHIFCLGMPIYKEQGPAARWIHPIIPVYIYPKSTHLKLGTLDIPRQHSLLPMRLGCMRQILDSRQAGFLNNKTTISLGLQHQNMTQKKKNNTCIHKQILPI